jgi:PKD repeat protein
MQSPAYTYVANGVYYPSLIGIDSTGTTVVSYSQPFAPATVLFTANPTNGTAPLNVQFNAANVDDLGNALTRWNWTFGDGTTSTLQNPLHTYASAGTFSPTLLATNSTGSAVLGSGPGVTVSQSPSVPFTATPTTGSIPLTVNFTAPGVDGGGQTLTHWNWTFDDGSTSTLQNPSHTYTTIGTFVPAFISTNGNGAAVTGSGPYITTSAAPAYSGLVLNGGFETGGFIGWTGSGNFSSTSVSTGPSSAHSGTYGLEMGPGLSLGFLSQTLATTPGAPYLLSFWLDSPDGGTPNEFLVSWNGTTLFDGTNLPALGWTNLQFLVTATGAGTVLEFGFRDDPSYLGLDDISVQPAQQPGIASFSRSGANLVFNGSNGVAGARFHLLTTTNVMLPRSQWAPVATNVLGAGGNFTVTLTNAVNPSNRERFYILQLQ